MKCVHLQICPSHPGIALPSCQVEHDHIHLHFKSLSAMKNSILICEIFIPISPKKITVLLQLYYDRQIHYSVAQLYEAV